MIDKRFPNWEVNLEEGFIYSKKYKFKIGTVNSKGYIKVKPPKGYNHWLAHQYIFMVGYECEIPEGYDVHHINGIKTDNRLCNLELILTEKHHKKHMENITEETRLKMSESKKGNKNMLGKHHSEETKKKISETKKGAISNKRKQVIQYTLDGNLVKVWDSATQCKEGGFNQGNVSLCCSGKFNKNNTYKGFIWKYK